MHLSKVLNTFSSAGNLYTLTTGSNEFRWSKMKNKVDDVVDSFEVFDKAPSGL